MNRLSRSVAVALVFVAALLALPAPSDANTTSTTVKKRVKVERLAGGVVVSDEKSTELVGPRLRKKTGQKWYPYRIVVSDGIGGYCVKTKWTTDAFKAELFPRVQPELGNVLSPPIARPDCPRTPRAERARVLVEEAWRRELQVVRPQLSVQPSFGITGKATFLTIGGKATDDFEIWNPIDEESIYVEATSTYVIDWGDRFNPDENRTVTESQGGPWPDGDLTHVYTTVDPDVTIRVTQHWMATWFAGDEAGVLEGLQTEAAVDDYVVAQVQAIRDR